MNFSISAVIKWIHDAIFGHEERIAALEQAVNVKPETTTPPPPPEVVAHVQAAPSVSEGVVGNNGLKVLWKDYAGQSDRQALPSITVRIGRGLTPEEVQAAYAAGIVRSVPVAQPDGPDPHAGDDLGQGGGKTIRRAGITPNDVVHLKFELSADDQSRSHKHLIVFGYPFVDFRNVQFTIYQNGAVVRQGSHYANTGNAGSGWLSQIAVGDLPPGHYETDLKIDGSGDAGYALNNA